MKLEHIIQKNFSSDSRLVQKDDVFFDFISNSKTTNPFIGDIIKKKPSVIITSKDLKKKNILTIKKKCVRNFYETLIKKKYKNIPKNLVAVTGTNGKTSIVNFFNQIHQLNNKKCATIGTLGFKKNRKFKKSNLTTPSNLEILDFLIEAKKSRVDNVAIEASSHGLVQNRLAGLAFMCSIFTNFTQDHLDYHNNMKSYLNAKLLLFQNHLKKKSTIICNNKIFKILIKNKIRKKNIKFPLQQEKSTTFKIISQIPNKSKTRLKINYKNKIYIIDVNLVSGVQVENLFQSIKACETVNLNTLDILKILPKIKAPNGRLNIIKNKNKLICLDYAHTPDGLEKSITTLKKHFNKEINIVFGCGGDRDRDKRSKMGYIANKYCKQIYLTNDNPRHENPIKIIKQIKSTAKRGNVIAHRSLAIKTAIRNLKKDQLLLVAGKGHENYQVFKNRKIFFSDKKEIKKHI